MRLVEGLLGGSSSDQMCNRDGDDLQNGSETSGVLDWENRGSFDEEEKEEEREEDEDGPFFGPSAGLFLAGGFEQHAFTMDIFPKEFKYTVIEHEEGTNSYCLRVALQNETEADSWVQAFGTTSASRWCVRRKHRNAKRIELHKYWSCHLSDTNRSSSKRTKKIGCTASLDIKIKKATVITRRRDKFLCVEPPLCAIVRLRLLHNHLQSSASDMRLLRPSAETVAQFEAYFRDGRSPAEAIQLHEKMIFRTVKNPEEVIANATLNPTYSSVYRHYYKWKKDRVGNLARTRSLNKIREKIDKYKEKGSRVYVEESDTLWAVLVVTPIMERTHAYETEQELAFIDSTSNCDSSAASLTLLFKVTKAGAIPLAVLIHSGQTEESFEFAFRLLKKQYPVCFGGKSEPCVFMTDDVKELKGAVRGCWPGSEQLLSRFHVAQAQWRWLEAAENNIRPERRRPLMSVFQKIMCAESDAKLQDAVLCLLECSEQNFISHVNDFLSLRNEWILLYRVGKITLSQNLITYSEATIRIIKDLLYGRIKAFNVVVLVDFCIMVLEEYLSRRIHNIALGNRSELQRREYDAILQRLSDRTTGDVRSEDEFVYYFPSETRQSVKYVVDVEVGLCSCPAGRQGCFCKHLAFVEEHYRSLFPKAPTLKSQDSRKLAVVAWGSKYPDIGFVGDSTEDENISQELSSVTTANASH